MTSAVELKRHRMAVAACFAFQRDTSSSVLVTTEMGSVKDFRFCPDTRLSPGGSARLKGCREQTLRFPKMSARWDFRTGADAVTIAGSDYPESIALIVRIGDHFSEQFDIKGRE
jgi:hypothetical protein